MAQEDDISPPERWVLKAGCVLTPAPPPKKKAGGWGGCRPLKAGGPSKLASRTPKAGFNYMPLQLTQSL